MSEKTPKVTQMPEQEVSEKDVQQAETAGQAEAKTPKSGFLKKDKKDKEKIAELEKKVEELEAKTAKDKDDYIRLMAEFDNYRRRTSQEKLEIVSMASTETIKGMLPVLDDCQRALQVLKDSNDSDAAKEGKPEADQETAYHRCGRRPGKSRPGAEKRHLCQRIFRRAGQV